MSNEDLPLRPHVQLDLIDRRLQKLETRLVKYLAALYRDADDREGDELFQKQMRAAGYTREVMGHVTRAKETLAVIRSLLK